MFVLLVHCIYNYYHELNSEHLTFVIAYINDSNTWYKNWAKYVTLDNKTSHKCKFFQIKAE